MSDWCPQNLTQHSLMSLWMCTTYREKKAGPTELRRQVKENKGWPENMILLKTSQISTDPTQMLLYNSVIVKYKHFTKRKYCKRSFFLRYVDEEDAFCVLPHSFPNFRLCLNFKVNGTISIVSSIGNQQLLTWAMLSHLSKGNFQ